MGKPVYVEPVIEVLSADELLEDFGQIECSSGGSSGGGGAPG